MRINWFKSGAYKDAAKELENSRRFHVHWIWAWRPRATRDKLVWFESLLARKRYNDGPWEYHLPEFAPKGETWDHSISAMVERQKWIILGSNLSELKFVVWPKVCAITGKLMFMRRAVVLMQLHEAGVPVYLYVDPITLAQERLTGNIK